MISRPNYLVVVIVLAALLAPLPFVTTSATAQQNTLSKPVLTAELRPTYVGLGTFIDMKDGQWTVILTVGGSPAEAAGITAGDIISTVDGQSLAGKSEEEVAALLPDQVGTVVALTVFRPSAQETYALLLTVSTIEPNIVELTWAAVSGAVHYEMWEWTVNDGWLQVEIDGSIHLTETEYQLYGLTAGVKYFYTVRAVDSASGVSEWSEYASITWTPPASTPIPTPSPTPTSMSSTEATATPTATAVAEAPSTATPTATPRAASVDSCTFVYTASVSNELQPQTLSAFSTEFGESPRSVNVHTAWFHPDSGTIDVGYLVLTSQNQWVMIWETWSGCAFSEIEFQLVNYRGIPLEE